MWRILDGLRGYQLQLGSECAVSKDIMAQYRFQLNDSRRSRESFNSLLKLDSQLLCFATQLTVRLEARNTSNAPSPQ